MTQLSPIYQALVINCSADGKWNAAALKALPIRSLCSTDAAVFLWCPSNCLSQGIAVLQEWGFKYHDILRSHIQLDQEGAPLMRKCIPMLLVGVRGKVLQRRMQAACRPYVCMQSSPINLQQTLHMVDGFLDVSRKLVVGIDECQGAWDAWSSQGGLLSSSNQASPQNKTQAADIGPSFEEVWKRLHGTQ